MDIDLLPFSAFALESAGSPLTVGLESQTLTLPLGVGIDPSDEPARGWITLGAAASPSVYSLSAAVLPAERLAFAITF